MGSTTSKPETKVFTPKVPLDYSPAFLSSLENIQESDYTRAQHTENFIQERVSSELRKLEEEAIEKYGAATSEALLNDTDIQQSSASSIDKVKLVSETLYNSALQIKKDIGDDVSNARNVVVNCLRENTGKPLNCWEEIEEFKKLVHDL